VNYKTVIYEKSEGVAIITLNRPEKRNALSWELSSELTQAIQAAEKDDEVGAIVITGGPKAFSAGADLSQAVAKPSDEPQRTGAGAIDKVADTPKPTIAAISGPCVAGGLALAVACDIRIASETARIGDGRIKMGLLGGIPKLPRLIGVGMAKELTLTGDLIDGNEALRIGLVNHVYPEGIFLDKAFELAKRIAKNPPIAAKFTKRAFDTGLQMNEYEAAHYSSLCAKEMYASGEYKERIAAFLKK
jgi:enoyl-CoA hydratase/carnithine racemase